MAVRSRRSGTRRSPLGIAPPAPESLDLVERLCDEHDVQLAVDHTEDGTLPHEWMPQCRSRSPRVGVYADVTSWLRPGIEPIDPIRTLADRLLVLCVRKPEGSARDAKVAAALNEIRRLGLKPTAFTVRVPAEQGIALFNKIVMSAAGRNTP